MSTRVGAHDVRDVTADEPDGAAVTSCTSHSAPGNHGNVGLHSAAPPGEARPDVCLSAGVDHAGVRVPTLRRAAESRPPNAADGIPVAPVSESQVTASTTAGVVTSFGFTANGDRTLVSGPGGAGWTYGFNQASQLVSARPAGGAVTSYTYTGDGLRRSSTTDGVTTRYVYDTTGSVPRLLCQTRAGVSVDFLYGPDGLPVEQVSSGNAGIGFFVSDQVGNTRALVDPTGAVTATYTYSPYGTVTATGTASTPLQYGRGYTDPTGLVYLINRYYDPTTGQFTSVDPLAAKTRSNYGYVSGNPVNATDSIGLDIDWGQVGLGVGIIVTVATVYALCEAGTFGACTVAAPLAAAGVEGGAGVIAGGLTASGVVSVASGSAVGTVAGMGTARAGTYMNESSQGTGSEASCDSTTRSEAASSESRVVSGTPRTNAAQNKKFNDAVRAAERQLGRQLSKDERTAVHREISGQGYGYHGPVDEVLGMFGGHG